jgi:hypothetical protein
MHRRSLLIALTIAGFAAFGVLASAASAELTVDERFEYNSPGMKFEAQEVGPAHCKGRYQVNPKKFPAKIEEFGYPGGGREIVTCRSTNHKPISGNIPPGAAFPLLNPAGDYWVSEWFKNFNPGESCFTISLPRDRAKGKMSGNGHSYHVVVYLEYTRECHPR